MIYPMYAIRDKKVGFLTPTIDQNNAAAIRNFEHACQQSQNLMFSHPEDFDLYRIGTFDTETGRLIPEEIPVPVVSAADM